MAWLESIAASLRDRARGLPDRHGGPVVCVLLGLICAVALYGRMSNVIDHEPLTPDAKGYLQISRSLYDNQQFGEPGQFEGAEVQVPSNYSPGAPLFVAGLYYLSFGVHTRIALGVIALLATLAVLFTYLIGRRLAGPWAGLLAAVPVAIYPALLVYGGMLMSEPLAAFTLTAGVLAFLWASERRDTRAWALPGLLLGATAMVRPEYLVIGFAFCLLALLKWGRERGWRPGARAAGLMIAAFLVPILPWTVRNLISLDRFVPISTGGGKALFIGTYLPGGGINGQTKVVLLKDPVVRAYVKRNYPPHSTHGKIYLDAVLGYLARRQYPNLPADEALAKMGRHNVSAYLSGHPGDFIHMLFHKAWYMWRKGPLKQMRTDAWVLFQQSLIFLAIAGLAIGAWRRRWEALVLATPILGGTAIGMVLLSHPRRALVLIPLVSALAGAAVIWLIGGALELLRRGRATSIRPGWKPAE